MDKISFVAKCTEDLQEIANSLLEWKPEVKIFALQGKMGAGKTTFIKALGDALKVEEVVSSPTFSLVNEYTSANLGPVFHFDFYRINKIEEVFDIGYEEYFYSGNYCFIEWPELVMDLLPESYILVEILVDKNEERTFNCTSTN